MHVNSFTVDSVIPPYVDRKYHSARIQTQNKRTFKPTAKKCCRIGRRAAKKKLSCSADGQRKLNRSYAAKFLNRRLSRTQKKTKQLMSKIEKCSRDYFKSVYKCCTYRESFYEQMKLCKKHKRKKRRSKMQKAIEEKVFVRRCSSLQSVVPMVPTNHGYSEDGDIPRDGLARFWFICAIWLPQCDADFLFRFTTTHAHALWSGYIVSFSWPTTIPGWARL